VRLQEAFDVGATGVQLGSIFALSEESGIESSIKRKLVDAYIEDTLEIRTDFVASPTGFPFKVAVLDGTMGDSGNFEERPRICDLGYLRDMLVSPDGSVSYRCAAEPVDDFVRKGGTPEAADRRMCLCNGLMATIGLGQVRENGPESPIVTAGDDFSFLDRVLSNGRRHYNAADVLEYMLGTDGRRPTSP
jgi:NAD(P)H-dependent flavin oxidoreductase YrpB (nitropropane dioxygenase family)